MSDDPDDLDRLTVEANGLAFACRRAGDGDPLTLCPHGFPDDAGSVDPLLHRLTDAGFTTVAPCARGYAPTDPAPDCDYAAGTLGWPRRPEPPVRSPPRDPTTGPAESSYPSIVTGG